MPTPTRVLPAATWNLGRIPAAVFGIAVLAALMLALPGQTAATRYLNDILIFLDGAYRISVGQVPNRDFHSALGPLTYYIPAVGLWLTGRLGAALPVGSAVLILLVGPMMAHILASRMRAILAIPLAAFLIVMLAAPINIGEGVTALSYGMFYNRIGWAVLSLLLVMYLPPKTESRRQTVLDAGSAAALTMLLVYLKVSYALVAIGFLVLMLAVSRQRRWAALALGIAALGGLLTELVWGASAAYVADLRLAADVGGALRGTFADRLRPLLEHLPDLTLFALLTGLALWRTRSVRDLMFFGFCLVSGYLVLSQNFQSWGMMTLYAAEAVAAALLLRSDGARAEDRDARFRTAAPLLLLAALLPVTLHLATALTVHSVAALRNAGNDVGLPNLAGLKLVNIWSDWEFGFFTGYARTLASGAAALEEFAPGARGVFVLDFVSPFSAGLGLQPPQGDSTWQHIGRTFSRDEYLPADVLFGRVQVVMEPKWPVEKWTYEGLRDIYMPYIEANFDLAGENGEWRVFVRKPGAGQGTSASATPDSQG